MEILSPCTGKGGSQNQAEQPIAHSVWPHSRRGALSGGRGARSMFGSGQPVWSLHPTDKTVFAQEPESIFIRAKH